MSEFIDSLAPNPYRLTGALKRRTRRTDWGLENLPQVADVLAEGPPDSYACLEDDQLEPTYVQIGGSCVPTSLSLVQSVDDWYDSEKGLWRMYDAQEMYHACGGPADGSRGVATQDVLDRMRQTGLLEAGQPRRARIAGYAFAPRVEGAWRRTIAAAMVASGPVAIATLLPEIFGWDSSGRLTAGYHQMAATRFTSLADNGLVIFPNTWGRAYGRNGFYRLSWSFLEQQNFQDGHTYAYQVVDLDDLEPEPTPDPPIGLVRFDAWVKVKKQGRKLATTLDESVIDLTRDAVAKLAGHVVEVSQPLVFKARVGIANRDFVMLKPIGGDTGLPTGQTHVELRVIE